MSLLKYRHDEALRKGNGRGPISFNRAHIDGIPFRGAPALLKEDEFDEYTATVHDAAARVFDLANEEHRQELALIVERAAAGWYQILQNDRHWVDQTDGTSRLYVYCVWVELYKELDKDRARGLML